MTSPERATLREPFLSSPPVAETRPALRPLMRFDRPSEWPRLKRMLDASFGRPAEAEFVEKLRDAGDFGFLILAELDEGFIGAVGFTPMPIVGETTVKAAALAPLAVAQSYRGRGVGAGLVRAGLAQCRRRGIDVVCALGARRFFERLGFSAEAAAAIETPSSERYLQALVLNDDSRPIAGAARYPSAFQHFET